VSFERALGAQRVRAWRNARPPRRLERSFRHVPKPRGGCANRWVAAEKTHEIALFGVSPAAHP